MSRSQKRFAQAGTALRQDVQHYLWLAFTWLVGRLNDWVLPSSRQLNAEAIAAWCQAYLAKRNPGSVQFRGMPVAEGESQPAVSEFSYRGRPVATGTAQPVTPRTEVPYVPFYQKSVRYWMNRLNLRDADRRAHSPEMASSYRGTSL